VLRVVIPDSRKKERSFSKLLVVFSKIGVPIKEFAAVLSKGVLSLLKI
jgi:hypothetical protein